MVMLFSWLIRSNLLKNSIIYTITDGISKGFAFLALPLVSHYLIPQELGIAANFDVLQSIVCLLAGQAMVNSMPYFYYGKTKQEKASIVSHLVFIVLVANIFISIPIILFTGDLNHYLHIGLSLQLMTIVLVVSQLVGNLDLILYRLEERPYIFATLQIIQTVVYFSLLILFVVDLRLNALGKILSGVVAYAAMSVVHIVLLWRRGYLKARFCMADFSMLIRFGIPLLPHSLSFWFKSGFDKIIITSFCGLTMNGLYSMALSFGAMYSIFNTAFSNSFIPYLQKRINEFTSENQEQEKMGIVRLSYKIMAIFLLLSIAVDIFCWLVVKYILDVQYADCYQFIPWIILGLTIYSMYGLVIQYPYSVKKTLGLGIITFTGSIVQFLLTYILISEIGIDGIKISYVLGSLIIMIGVWIYSNYVYPMPWFSCKILKRNL